MPDQTKPEKYTIPGKAPGSNDFGEIQKARHWTLKKGEGGQPKVRALDEESRNPAASIGSPTRNLSFMGSPPDPSQERDQLLHPRGEADPRDRLGLPQGPQQARGNPRMRNQFSQPPSPVFFP